MADDPLGCARVTGTVGGVPASAGDEPPGRDDSSREVEMTARVGQQAPDFTAPAYHDGGFTSVTVSYTHLTLPTN